MHRPDFRPLVSARKPARVLTLLLLLTTLCGTASEPRVVSLSPAMTELVFALGKGDTLVGRSEACDYPPEVRELPTAGAFGNPQLESLLRLKTQVMLTNALINPGVIKPLTKAGVQVLFLPCDSLEEYRVCVENVGRQLDANEEAAKETARIDELLAHPSAATGVRLLWVVWDSPLMVAGGGSFPDEVIRLAGGINVAGEIDQPYFRCSFDWLLRQPIDAIVWTAKPRNDLTEHRFWGKLFAVQQQRVWMNLNADALQRPGPRLFDGIAELHRKLKAVEEAK